MSPPSSTSRIQKPLILTPTRRNSASSDLHVYEDSSNSSTDNEDEDDDDFNQDRDMSFSFQSSPPPKATPSKPKPTATASNILLPLNPNPKINVQTAEKGDHDYNSDSDNDSVDSFGHLDSAAHVYHITTPKVNTPSSSQHVKGRQSTSLFYDDDHSDDGHEHHEAAAALDPSNDEDDQDDELNEDSVLNKTNNSPYDESVHSFKSSSDVILDEVDGYNSNEDEDENDEMYNSMVQAGNDAVSFINQIASTQKGKGKRSGRVEGQFEDVDEDENEDEDHAEEEGDNGNRKLDFGGSDYDSSNPDSTEPSSSSSNNTNQSSPQRLPRKAKQGGGSPGNEQMRRSSYETGLKSTVDEWKSIDASDAPIEILQKSKTQQEQQQQQPKQTKKENHNVLIIGGNGGGQEKLLKEAMSPVPKSFEGNNSLKKTGLKNDSEWTEVKKNQIIQSALQLQLQPKLVLDASLPMDEWKSALTPAGKHYYYNRRTRESSWTLPPDAKIVDGKDGSDVKMFAKSPKEKAELALKKKASASASVSRKLELTLDDEFPSAEISEIGMSSNIVEASDMEEVENRRDARSKAREKSREDAKTKAREKAVLASARKQLQQQQQRPARTPLSPQANANNHNVEVVLTPAVIKSTVGRASTSTSSPPHRASLSRAEVAAQRAAEALENSVVNAGQDESFIEDRNTSVKKWRETPATTTNTNTNANTNTSTNPALQSNTHASVNSSILATNLMSPPTPTPLPTPQTTTTVEPRRKLFAENTQALAVPSVFCLYCGERCQATHLQNHLSECFSFERVWNEAQSGSGRKTQSIVEDAVMTAWGLNLVSKDVVNEPLRVSNSIVGVGMKDQTLPEVITSKKEKVKVKMMQVAMATPTPITPDDQLQQSMLLTNFDSACPYCAKSSTNVAKHLVNCKQYKRTLPKSVNVNANVNVNLNAKVNADVEGASGAKVLMSRTSVF